MRACAGKARQKSVCLIHKSFGSCCCRQAAYATRGFPLPANDSTQGDRRLWAPFFSAGASACGTVSGSGSTPTAERNSVRVLLNAHLVLGGAVGPVAVGIGAAALSQKPVRAGGRAG
jgi:hypothetical protein